MSLSELTQDCRNRGYWQNSTVDEIRADIARLQAETASADKRTYNGKMIRVFNDAKIAIARLIIKAAEQEA